MPHHLKYALAHSGTTLDRPSRAKARTSSKTSQGFFSRFRRSMRWALDSLVGGAAVAVIFLSFSGINEKPTGNGGLSGDFVRGVGSVTRRSGSAWDNTHDRSKPEWSKNALQTE